MGNDCHDGITFGWLPWAKIGWTGRMLLTYYGVCADHSDNGKSDKGHKALIALLLKDKTSYYRECSLTDKT